MPIPEILAELCGFADRQERQGLYDCRALPTDSLRAYADRVGEAYVQLIGKIAKLSRGFDQFNPNGCPEVKMSEEYLKEYAETYDFKYPPEEGDDAWLEDARSDMDLCFQCDDPDCVNVKLRKLVRELKEGMTCHT